MALTELLPNAAGDFFALPQSDWIDSRSLGIATAEVQTVPEGARFVLFASTTDFYAKMNAAAAVPADVVNGTASELNPTMRKVIGVATIGLISPAASIVTMSFYK